MYFSSINESIYLGISFSLFKTIALIERSKFFDTKKAVEDVKKGRVEYRTDSYANVHALVGKVSFEEEKLADNIKAFMDVIIKSKPQI